MAELLTGLFASYGLPGMALALALAQFGVPLPTSFLLMGVGALLATLEFTATEAFVWGLGGTVAGDQAGYWTGRVLGGGLEKAARASPLVSSSLTKATELSHRWGAGGIFLTRWLISPLGPWINLTSGATGIAWPIFTVWAVIGEAIWVAAYFTLGFVFSASISGIASVLANAGWTIAALAATVVLGWRIRALLAAHRHAAAAAGITPDTHPDAG